MVPCPVRLSIFGNMKGAWMEGKGSVVQTYRLVCRGRSGQLRWLPSSHGGLEAVVGSNGCMKRFLGVSKKKKEKKKKVKQV